MLDGNSNGRDSVATKFLKAVNTYCRAFETYVEAAEYARRKCFSLQNYFGMHSLFLTITPDDQCCFRIRLYVNSKAKVSLSGLLITYHSLCIQLVDFCLSWSTCQHTLTPLDCTEDDLLADLKLRKRDQIK